MTKPADAATRFTLDFPETDDYYWWLQRGNNGWYGGLVLIVSGGDGWPCADGKRRNVAGRDGPLIVIGQPVYWSAEPVDPERMVPK